MAPVQGVLTGVFWALPLGALQPPLGQVCSFRPGHGGLGDMVVKKMLGRLTGRRRETKNAAPPSARRPALPHAGAPGPEDLATPLVSSSQIHGPLRPQNEGWGVGGGKFAKPEYYRQGLHSCCCHSINRWQASHASGVALGRAGALLGLGFPFYKMRGSG